MRYVSVIAAILVSIPFCWVAAKSVLLSAVRVVYLNGPSVLGGWEGQSSIDICSRITATASGVWVSNPGECDKLIEKKIYAHLIGWLAVLICVATYQFISAAWSFYWWRVMGNLQTYSRIDVRPITN